MKIMTAALPAIVLAILNLSGGRAVDAATSSAYVYPGSDKLLVTSAAGILRYNLATGRALPGPALSAAIFIPPSAELQGPGGITVGPAGRIYTSSEDNYYLVDMYGPTDGHFIRSLQTQANNHLVMPGPVAFGPDKLLYVVGSYFNGSGDALDGAPQIERYEPGSGTFVDVFVPPSATYGVYRFRGLCFGPNGDLFVSADYSFYDNVLLSLSTVLRYNGKTGELIGQFVPTGQPISTGGLAHPYGLHFGPDGDLYVADFGDDYLGLGNTGRVVRYNGLTGQYTDTVVPYRSGDLTLPVDIAFGSNGIMYVSNLGSDLVPNDHNGAILRYSAQSGRPFQPLVASATGPAYLAIEPGS